MCSKKNISNHFIQIIALVLCHLSENVCVQNAEFTSNDRHSRGIVYPPSTVIQFSLGLAVPSQVPNRSIFTNLGLINNVPLPNNVTQFYPLRMKRSIREFTHQNFYNLLEDTFDSWSFKNILGASKIRSTFGNEERRPTDCVQRCICQLASLQSSLDKRPELLLKMLHFLFLPMKNGYVEADSTYLTAERRGAQLSTANCAVAYPACPISPLEMVLNIN